MIMTNKMYDILKWIAQLLLPALATFYFVLSGIWGFPYGEQVVGSIAAIDTFLGVLLGVSNAKYNTYKAEIVKEESVGDKFGLFN